MNGTLEHDGNIMLLLKAIISKCFSQLGFAFTVPLNKAIICLDGRVVT